jgi:hypothetical protein
MFPDPLKLNPDLLTLNEGFLYGGGDTSDYGMDVETDEEDSSDEEDRHTDAGPALANHDHSIQLRLPPSIEVARKALEDLRQLLKLSCFNNSGPGQQNHVLYERLECM